MILSRNTLVTAARLAEITLPLMGQDATARLVRLMADMLEEDAAVMRQVDERVMLIERQLAAYVESLNLR